MRTAATVVMIGVALILAGCGASHGANSVVAGGTTSMLRGRPPAWTASSNPPAFTPYAVGSHGTAAGFIFGYPLRAGNPTNPHNKILWIVREPGTRLVIDARPLGARTPVITVRLDDSAGQEIYPSYVNVPTAGCWHLTLRWAGHTDSLELSYRAGRSAPRSLTQTGPSGGQRVAGVWFVRASRLARAECRQAADAVGYAVPCPMMLPAGIVATPGIHGCQLELVAPGYQPGCQGSTQWRGWIVGSTQLAGVNAGPAGFEHLVLAGAPEVIHNPARAIDGPPMIAGSRVQALGTVIVDGRLMRWYYVPPNLNIGSAFAHHLVLVWNAAGHTYAYGFHVIDGIANARARDLELAQHLVMIESHG